MIPEQDDLAVCMLYENRAVLVAVPTEANTVYAIRAALRSEGITGLDAVFLPPGQGDGIPYVSQILSGYIDGVPVYRDFDGTVSLSQDIRATRHASRLYVECGDVRVVFAPDTTSTAVESADVVFCNRYNGQCRVGVGGRGAERGGILCDSAARHRRIRRREHMDLG